MNAMEFLVERIVEAARGGVREFTVEFGRGETYANSKPTVYGHGVYPRGSVLAGRAMRKYVGVMPVGPEGIDAALAAITKAVKAAGVKRVRIDNLIDDHGSGSTHVPLDVLTAGLPDDDY